MFFDQRFELEADQFVEAHVQDRVCLRFCESELRRHDLGFFTSELDPAGLAVDEAVLDSLTVSCAAQDLDDQVDHVDRFDESLLDLSLFPLFLQKIFILPSGGLIQEICICLEDLPEAECLRLTVPDREHIYAECVLQTRLFVEEIAEIVYIRVLAKFNDNPNAFFIGLVGNINDIICYFLFRERCHVREKFADPGADHCVGDLRDHEVYVSRAALLDCCAASEANFSRSCLIDLSELVFIDHDAPGREIGAFYICHQVPVSQVRIFQKRDLRVDHFREIVGRRVGSHTNRDSLRTVDKEIGDLDREHFRLFLVFIKVGDKVHHVLVQVREKRLLGDLFKPGFCISHRCGAVPFDVAEVAVSVDQRQFFFEILRHDDQSVVDRAVSVRVIFTHCIADDTRALSKGLVRADPELVHIIERAPLNRFESVSDVGKRSRHDNTHRIVDIGFLHQLGIFCLEDLFLRCLRKCILRQFLSLFAVLILVVSRHIYSCFSVLSKREDRRF